MKHSPKVFYSLLSRSAGFLSEEFGDYGAVHCGGFYGAEFERCCHRTLRFGAVEERCERLVCHTPNFATCSAAGVVTTSTTLVMFIMIIDNVIPSVVQTNGQ